MSAGKSEAVKAVSVKALVEFAAKSGSLDRRFTPSPSALEGMEGHRKVAAQRAQDYQTEVSLKIHYKGLLIRGRADGYQPDYHCLEEIKTFYGDFAKIPENHRLLHWAQAKMYGWMFCVEHECDHIALALIYYNLSEQKEYRLQETFSVAELELYCQGLAEKYADWQQQINLRLSGLHSWIENLSFPYPELHPSQRQMAEAVYKSAATGRVLLAEAPTGTGKTLAGIFPALKAFSKTPVDKLFYLTAKTTGKQLALENIQLIASDATASPLRVLELTAQEKACLEPDKRCAGDSCVFAENFYTKLQQVRLAAYEISMLDKNALAQLARQYQICPFYLSMEMSRWVDIVVADFNYYFDSNALLLGLTKEFNWHPYLLVDESHNLLDRGRQMYSAALNRGLLLEAKQQAPQVLKKMLGRVNRAWLDMIKPLDFNPARLTTMAAVPEKLLLSLMEFTTKYSEFLQQQPDHPVQTTAVQELFFAALNFQAIQELVNEDFCIDIQGSAAKKEIISLRNLVPAQLIAERIAFAHSACFFSATLQPIYFYKVLLGLPEDTVSIQVASPFQQDQLCVKIAENLSTRYRDRSSAIKPICATIKQQLQACKGNALVFFSSYEFLQQVEQELLSEIDELDIHLLAQSKSMSEEDRQQFIRQFTARNDLLGLAVLGGAFSEGVDLPGDALKGVFIATLGLPQLNPVMEHMREYMQGRFHNGYNFTYLYPGIQKVIQAAGRVIRTTQDTGYLWLLDQRFAQLEIKRLLPAWWGIQKP